jgi:parvulin-like peptidyl-prolyl isomerase
MKISKKWLIFALTPLLVSCGEKEAEEAAEPEQIAVEQPEEKETGEPDHIVVQHLLVSFKGAPRMTKVTRSQAEAKTLAYQLLETAKAGEDFDELVKEFTDDSHPGIYKMANRGVVANRAAREYERDGMVPAFGDVGFVLKVGELGIADHDAQSSPYGWHIIKRIE